jgi:exopolysaccharide biosynthesis polyprenyl glycosylphosphotransferase
MFHRFSHNFALFSIGMDAALVAISLLAASQMRPLLSFLPYAIDVRKPMQLPPILYPIFAAIWIGIFLGMSVYDGRRNLRVADELMSVTIGSLLAGVFLAGTLYLSYRDVSRVLFLVFILMAYLGFILWRILTRISFRWSKSSSTAFRRVLIIGAGPVGLDLNDKIVSQSYLGLRVVGFLDDDSEKQNLGTEILGDIDEAREVILRERIDDVVIALPGRAFDRLNRLIVELLDLPVKVMVIPDYYNKALHKAVIEEFAGIPMLDLRAPALNDYQRLVKRAFDILFCLLVFPISIILMGIIALAIRLEGKGPILFRQKRVGENGRLFEMLKFRTMVPEAEDIRHLVEQIDEDGILIHKSANDPRVTRVGRYLRRTSLDELPQLINVIKGDMSVIGPRPELPYLVELYEPWQRQRFAVPQGMTGWWQVNGRSDKLMHLNTEDDLYYVEHYSLFLDLQILVKTLGVVFRGKGAF